MQEDSLRSAGLTDVGLTREENQDCIFVDQSLGLYLVLDGMGGHQGGATASRVGCEVVVDIMRRGLSEGRAPGPLLKEAVQAAGLRIHNDANQNPELQGMGTTFVGIMMPSPDLAIIAHVGDSRAYLMRDQRITRLTSDHTVVAELVAMGKLTPEEAQNHPHSSVLSRNLGGLPTTEVEFGQLDIMSGDRLLLCSDGLNGYATQGAIEKTLGGAIDPGAASADLVDLAKRGGGGDNVSAVVIEIGPRAGETIPNLVAANMESGAQAWWARRPLFIDVCQRMGLAQSAVAVGLSAEEAIELLADSFCEAVYHDLKNTTGVHVWTFADSLVSTWFGRGGIYMPIQELFDILRAGSMAVVKDVTAIDENFGVCLEIALLRSLIVGEMVIGGQIGAQIKSLNENFVATEKQAELPETTFSGNATIPFGSIQAPKPSAPDVGRCLTGALEMTRKTLSANSSPVLRNILTATATAADDFHGNKDMCDTARELYGTHLLTEQELNPIASAIDTCREAHLLSVSEQSDIVGAAQTRAYCYVASAYRSLYRAFALVAVEAGKPTTDQLNEVRERTTQMRAQIARNEDRLTTTDIDTVEETSP